MSPSFFNLGKPMLLASLLGLLLGLSGCGGGDGTTGTAAGIITPPGGGASGGGLGPQSLAQRPLPAILSNTSTKAINYSAYRTTLGPNVGEQPTDAQISEDLTLLSQAGFNLLRIFASDPSHANILRVAQSSFPNLRFQLGIYLQGIALSSQASCTDATNDAEVQAGIAWPSSTAMSWPSASATRPRSFPSTCR